MCLTTYNKLLETESIGLTIIALTNNFRQKNKQATSLKLVGELLEEVKSSRTNNILKAKYGRLANEESISYDSVKLETKLLAYKSWKKRRSVTTTVVQPLYAQKKRKHFSGNRSGFCPCRGST